MAQGEGGRQRAGGRGPVEVEVEVERQRAGGRLNAEDPRVVWAVRIGFALLVLAVWQFTAARLGANFVASPGGMVSSAVELVRNGELVRYGLPTLWVLVAGFVLGLVVGVPVGMAIGRWRRLYLLSEGPINLFYTTPLAAMIPVLLVILGFGVSTKIFVVFVFVVFSVIINSAAGVRNVDGDLLELARSYGSSERSRWREIIIPSALPFVLTGVRIGIGRALIGAHYLVRRHGPLSFAASLAGAFARTTPDATRPDVQFHFQPLSLDRYDGALHAFSGFTISVCQLRPLSRGTIALRSPDPREPPAITARAAGADEQGAAVRAGRRARRCWCWTPPRSRCCSWRARSWRRWRCCCRRR